MLVRGCGRERPQPQVERSAHALLDITPDTNVVREFLFNDLNSRPVRSTPLTIRKSSSAGDGLMSFYFPTLNGGHVACQAPNVAKEEDADSQESNEIDDARNEECSQARYGRAQVLKCFHQRSKDRVVK